MRHAGAVYGASRGRAPGSKHIYRPIWSGGRWNEFLESRALGSVLQVCCGASRVGRVRVDRYRAAPGVTVIADLAALPFKPASFDTAACDPPYEIVKPLRVHLQRELARVARRRILFKAPWIPRAAGWRLSETVLVASHTCSNVAVLAVLDRSDRDQLSFMPRGI